MDYSDEPYVRKYTRKTLTSRLLGWEGRTVLDAMLGEFDAAGIFAIRGDAAVCIAAVTEIPVELVRIGLQRLIETETWVVTARAITWPTYEEAQNCRRSDRLRQRESRRARAARSVTDVTPPSSPVTDVTTEQAPVTDVTSGHVESRSVTLPPSHPPSQRSLSGARARGVVTGPESEHSAASTGATASRHETPSEPAQPVETESSPRIIRKVPEDYVPSEGLLANVAAAGYSRDRFLARLAEYRLGPIGGTRGVFAHKLEEHLLAMAGKWKTWDANDAAKALSRPKGAPGPAKPPERRAEDVLAEWRAIEEAAP